jgi:hypothetical protein
MDQFHAVMRPTRSIVLDGALRVTEAPFLRPSSLVPKRRRFCQAPIGVYSSVLLRAWAYSERSEACWFVLVLVALEGIHPTQPGSSRPPWEDGLQCP